MKLPAKETGLGLGPESVPGRGRLAESRVKVHKAILVGGAVG